MVIRVLQIMCVAMLVGGSTAFATTTNGEERQELQTISSWMAHLNSYYPGLSVNAESDLTDATVRSEVLNQLQMLEGIMSGDFALPDGSLMLLACGKPVCDGGGGGKCKMCD